MANDGIDERDPKRIVLFGMECAFTTSFIEALSATGMAEIAAIVLPGPVSTGATSFAQKGPSGPIGRCPIVAVSGRRELLSRGFVSALEGFDADSIVVACFPWRIPTSVFTVPREASVNIHPSLLPDGRGPEPIFWAFRRGLHRTGVTLHVLDEGLDTGPIVAQRIVEIKPGATMISLERTLAGLGADMVGDFLSVPYSSVAARPQAAGEGSAAPFPNAEDLIVTTAWNVTTAARFIDAVGPVYGPIEVLVLASGQRLAVAEVLGIDSSDSCAFAVRFRGDEAWIRFPDGTLHCRLRTMQQRLELGT